jgi:hypothetical protein
VDNKKSNKKLLVRRFIITSILITIGLILLLDKTLSALVSSSILSLLDNEIRSSAIYIFALIVGALYYFFVGKNKPENRFLFFSTSMGLVDSIASAIGYSFIINKGINFALGVYKDYFHIDKFFVHPEQVDHITLFIVSIVAISIGGLRLFKMLEQFIFEFAYETVTPISDEEKNKEGKNGEKSGK